MSICTVAKVVFQPIGESDGGRWLGTDRKHVLEKVRVQHPGNLDWELKHGNARIKKPHQMNTPSLHPNYLNVGDVIAELLM